MLKHNGDFCPFCNGSDIFSFTAAAHDAAPRMVNIIECRTCEAGWQWPLQRSEQQSVVEFENSYAEHEEGTYFDPLKREAVAACQREFIETKTSPPARLLDIGCGDGNFARHMARRGWDVTGLDPALRAAVTEEASPGRLRLLPGSIAALPKHQVFEVITLWDVIEHVENPDQIVAAAADRLVPGGCLVVETGNYQSEGRVQSNGTWWNYQVDHRWYFAPPQLSVLLTKAGLETNELADRVLRPWWHGQREMSPPRLMSLAKTVAKKPWQFGTALRIHRELVRVNRDWKGWGGLEIMTMVGRKPKDAHKGCNWQ